LNLFLYCSKLKLKILLVLGRRTGAHREDWLISVVNDWWKEIGWNCTTEI